MDDFTLRYFDAEMRYLREAAKEFAQAHPDRAALLDLDKAGIPDPFVERLLEGFAFSMGRLRQKIDDDLPEFTEGLVSLLWPHYLRTVPSLAIVQFSPEIERMKMAEPLPANIEVLSRPIGDKQTVCRYRTTQALTLNPLQLTDVTLSTELDGRSVIQLHFACSEQADWQKVDLSQLSLFLNGDMPTALALHLALTKRVSQMYIRHSQDDQRHPFNGYCSPGGFSEQEKMWPNDENGFSGYQLLLEYFLFKTKFLFIQLHGLAERRLPDKTQYFVLEIVLTTLWDPQLPLTADHLRLHCVPVINLFNLEADPLTVNGFESEYLLRPKRLQDGHIEIYSVDSVTGSAEKAENHYVPFRSFRHRGGMLRPQAVERYYHTRIKRGVNGLHDTWLILGGQQHSLAQQFTTETLSLQITGTNGQLPRKALQSTLLDRCEYPFPMPCTIRNLCKPTLPAYPPAEDRFHWRVLSHLGSSFLHMMANKEVLKSTLALYNWQDDEMNKRQLDAILTVQHQQTQRFVKGFLLRGIDIEITVDSQGFIGEGDIHLFGEMLNRFFALYADIHLFNQLTLVIQPTGKRLQWNENHNQQLPR